MKLNKNLSLYIIMALLLVSCVNAITYEKGEEVDIKVPFEVNGSYPSAAAWCKISIQYPNTTYLKNNVSMFNLGNGEFNVTLITTETTELGVHEWIANCCDGLKCARGYDSFEITATGKPTPDSLPVVMGIIIIIVFGFAWFFLILAFKVVEPGPKIFFIISSMVFLIASIGIAIMFAQDSNITESISGLMGNILFALGMILFVIFAYILIKQLVVTMNLFKYKRGLGYAKFGNGFNPNQPF